MNDDEPDPKFDNETYIDRFLRPVQKAPHHGPLARDLEGAARGARSASTETSGGTLRIWEAGTMSTSLRVHQHRELERSGTHFQGHGRDDQTEHAGTRSVMAGLPRNPRLFSGTCRS